MKTKLITPPTVEPISVPELRDHLRVTGTDEDELLSILIKAAREHVESITRRALITQTWEYYLDAFPKENYIVLPFGNLQMNEAAAGTITSSGVNVSNNDTVTIDTKVYTFRNNPVAEGHVDIGVDASESLGNLRDAINHIGSPGVNYICAVAHPTVVVSGKTDTVLTLTSIIGGVEGNLIALSTTAASLSASGAFISGGFTAAEIKYFDSEGLAVTMVYSVDYIMEFNGDQLGKIVLPYACTWPSVTMFPSNPVVIKFTVGWKTPALVPSSIKTAIKMVAADLYENRGERILGQTMMENKTVELLLSSWRLWGSF